MEREVMCIDSIPWLLDQAMRGGGCGAIVTSLPDAEELNADICDWQEWFTHAASACLAAASKDAPVIFYQTDRKHNGRWISKAELLLRAADSALGSSVLRWHKIALRRRVGTHDLYRPGYAHLMCFSKTIGPGIATPDVFSAGKTLYNNGMGFNAAHIALQMCVQCRARIVVDPFCGQGTVLLAAAGYDFDHVFGIDIDETQCELSRSALAEPVLL